MTHTVTHLTKGAQDDDTPPTPVELHDRLIQQAAQQIASHLVNTTSRWTSTWPRRWAGRGGQAMDQKLWSRALEQLETMKPSPSRKRMLTGCMTWAW